MAWTTQELHGFVTGSLERGEPFGLTPDAPPVPANWIMEYLARVRPSERKLTMTDVTVSGPLRLEGVGFGGPVELRHCRFSDGLVLSEATLPSLNLGWSKVAGGLWLGGMTVSGTLNLELIEVSGYLVLRETSAAFVELSGATVRAEGRWEEIDLSGLRVSGDLWIEGSHRPDEPRRFVCNRPLWLPKVAVGGELRLNNLDVTCDVPRYQLVSGVDPHTGMVSLEGADVRDLWVGQRLGRQPPLIVSLQDARIGTLNGWPEPPPASEPPPDEAAPAEQHQRPPYTNPLLLLDGCVYERQRGDPVTLETLRAFERHTGFRPQPYDQLADALTREGGHDRARRVQIAKQQRRSGTLSRPGRAWGWVLDKTTAYGYKPARALWWLGGLIATAALLFGVVLNDQLEPAKSPPQHFNALIYAIDLVVPLVNLGQRDAWRADGVNLAQFLAPAFSISGWVLASVFASGLASRRL